MQDKKKRVLAVVLSFLIFCLRNMGNEYLLNQQNPGMLVHNYA
jgi:hypothetical protein